MWNGNGDEEGLKEGHEKGEVVKKTRREGDKVVISKSESRYEERKKMK